MAPLVGRLERRRLVELLSRLARLVIGGRYARVDGRPRPRVEHRWFGLSRGGPAIHLFIAERATRVLSESSAEPKSQRDVDWLFSALSACCEMFSTERRPGEKNIVPGR